MKNLKNKVAAMGLMAIFGMGATAANAGIMMSDKGASCGNTTIVNQLEGIIIVGLSAAKGGIMMSDLTGILMGDVASQCTQNKDGIIIVGK